MSKPVLSVVVPARNAASTLPETLEALGKQDTSFPFEVFVVDDGSEDGTAEIASENPVVTDVLRLSGEGPARARNAGAAASSGSYLAFLDADCRPVSAWLTAGHEALQSLELVLGLTRPRPDQYLGPFDHTLSVVGCSPLFESANLFVRRELFERLGGFETWLVPRRGKELGEDVWFGWRARRAGARIGASPHAVVDHANFPRGPAAFAAERWRLRFFPALAGRIPELRDAFFHHRYFLSPRSERFDIAVAGILMAGLTRKPWAALAALPYLRTIAGDVRVPRGAANAAARLAADAIGLMAMLGGSLRYRALLL